VNRLNGSSRFKVRLGSRFRVLLFLVFVAPGVASAQAPRVEVGGGVRWMGGAGLGDPDATMRTASGGSFVQFASASELGPVVAVEGRVGVRLTRSLQAEAGMSYGTTELRTELASDVEGIPDATVAESVTRYTIEGALVASLDGWRWGGLVPFVSVGGGYLRELHEGRTLVESGRMFHAGGGVTVPLRTQMGAGTTIGVRADARAVVRSGGVQFDDDALVVPAVGASVFFRF